MSGPVPAQTSPPVALAAPVSFGMGHVPPELLLGLSIVSIQAGSALATTLFDQVGPAGITLLKTLFAAVVLTIASRGWRGGDIRPHAALLFGFGAVIATMFVSSYEALARMPMGVAATIGFLGPLGLAVAHSRRPTHFILAALALLGVLLLTPDLFAHDLAAHFDGLVWAAISALAWAGFIVLSPRVSRNVPGLRGLALGMAAASALLVPYAILDGGIARTTPAAAAMAFVVALLTAIVPTSLEYTALHRISARGYGIIISTEPAVAAIAGALLLSQSLGVADMAGIGLVCAASLGMTWSDRHDRSDRS